MRIECSTQPLPAGAPSELVVFAPGVIETTRYEPWMIDERAGRAIEASFARGARDCVIDYEHATDQPAQRHDGTAPAAGWIKGIRWDSQRGVVATVDWTERGGRAVAAREYRYFSPAGRVERGDDGVVRFVRLDSLALTNKPATRGASPIAAADRGEEPDGLSDPLVREWESDAALRAEFGEDFGAFRAYRKADGRGTAAAVPARASLSDRLGEWDRRAALRDEFAGDRTAYAAYCRADARGLVRASGLGRPLVRVACKSSGELAKVAHILGLPEGASRDQVSDALTERNRAAVAAAIGLGDEATYGDILDALFGASAGGGREGF